MFKFILQHFVAISRSIDFSTPFFGHLCQTAVDCLLLTLNETLARNVKWIGKSCKYKVCIKKQVQV